MLGVIPAAGAGRRLRPLPFSKELLPVGSRYDDGQERPRAVSEFIVERLIDAGADRLCFVIGPSKHDIVAYYGGSVAGVPICYVIQPEPAGLCDSIFRALPFAQDDETVVVGLPDTVWFPVDGLRALPEGLLAFLLFPVEEPQRFESVVVDDDDRVREIQVKHTNPESNWIWGAFQAPGRVLKDLHALWLSRAPRDESIGTLVNEYLRRGGRSKAVRAGTSYMGVGTLGGYREAFAKLHGVRASVPPESASFRRDPVTGGGHWWRGEPDAAIPRR